MTKKESVSTCLVCDFDKSDSYVITPTMMAEQNEKWEFRKCRRCGMVYLSPRVKAEHLDSYYSTSYLPYRGATAWGTYSKFVEKDQRNIDGKRLITVQRNMVKGAKTILDIGCGKPTFLELTQEKLGIQAIGLDFSDNGWKNDRERFKKIDLYVGDIENNVEHIQADVITMWHYLEHDYNPKKTLRLLSETQKKGAKLIIEVPNHDSFSRRKHNQFWSGYHSPRHTGLYTLSTMKQLLESSGWKVENQYSYGTLDPYTLDWMSRMERDSIDWTSSMEDYFMDYIIGKIVRPRYFFPQLQSLGFMTTIARNKY